MNIAKDKKKWSKPKIINLMIKNTQGGTPYPDRPEDISYAPTS